MDPPRGLLPRAPRPTARAEMRATQRARVLVAMADCVAEHGYHATTVAAVAKRAGVSTRAFYEHFADKEACLLDLYDVAVRTAVERLWQAAGRGDRPWRERFTSTVHAWFGLLASEPSFTRIYAIDVWSATDASRERAVAGTRTMVDVLRWAGDQARTEDPRVHEPSELELQLLVGGLHRVTLLYVLDGRTAALGEVAPEVAAHMVASLTRRAA